MLHRIRDGVMHRDRGCQYYTINRETGLGHDEFCDLEISGSCVGMCMPCDKGEYQNLELVEICQKMSCGCYRAYQP